MATGLEAPARAPTIDSPALKHCYPGKSLALVQPANTVLPRLVPDVSRRVRSGEHHRPGLYR